jgi:hypothetical protein
MIRLAFTCWALLPLALFAWWFGFLPLLGITQMDWKDIIAYLGGIGLAAFTLGIIIALWEA